MIPRYFVSFNFAALITFFLFYAMQMLIANDDIILMPSVDRKVVILTEARKIVEDDFKVVMPVKQDVEETPEIEFTRQVSKGKNLTPAVNLGTKEKDIFQKPTDINFSKGEGAEQPIVRVAPQYPSGPLSNGIEGYVIVEFTVTAQGNTADVIAVESSHRGFERNAIRAVEKFKYKPRVIDGVAIQVLDLKTRITFTLEK